MAYLLLSQSRQSVFNAPRSAQFDSSFMGAEMSVSKSVAPSSYNSRNVAPAPDVTNRMVVTSSHLSLLVNDVSAGMTGVKSYIDSIGGYMVSSNISRPEQGATGTITVRIPSIKLDEALAALKNQSVKVVSERMDGHDVTDQFVDNEARLVILERNKARFEEIMTSAKDVPQILEVQNEIFNLQAQIDSIKGQHNYLEQTAKMSLVTVYLSTDELALPYAPTQAWRPAVVFKLAVRSLIGFGQSIGTGLIWITVFSVIWVPVLAIVLFVVKRRKTAQAI